jgi:hypothetical protein
MLDLRFSQRWLDITPCSSLKVKRRYRGTSPPSSGSNEPSKISGPQRTTRRHIREDSTLELKEIMYGDVEWIHLAQDRFQCLVVMNTGLNRLVL